MTISLEHPKVSIVICQYNNELFCKQCIDSVMRQTLADIEIICIDDFSTDNTLSIIKRLAMQDSRIKLIAHKENLSAHQSRIDGVLASKGDLLMFLDGDDELELNACLELYEEFCKNPVDILNFRVKVEPASHVRKSDLAWFDKFLNPYQNPVEGEDIFYYCFRDRVISFTIWSKAYKGEFARYVFEKMEGGVLRKAEDLYESYCLAYYAKAYLGIEGYYYRYRFGFGITGSQTLSIEKFKIFNQQSETLRACERFSASVGKLLEHQAILDRIRENLMSECRQAWFVSLNRLQMAQGFTTLVNSWPHHEVLASIRANYISERETLASAVKESEALKSTARIIKRIGIFYHRLSISGGVERVISLLMPIYLSMGYEIVLFLEEYGGGCRSIPDGVELVILPTGYGFLEDKLRYEVIETEVIARRVDVFCYHSASHYNLLFDLLAVKLTHIPFVLIVHEVPFEPLLTQENTDLAHRPAVYSLADDVIVLSKTFEYYYKCLGVHARYIPNPIPFIMSNTDEESSQNNINLESNSLVWVGRADAQQKQLIATVQVIAEIKRFVPDVLLRIVGPIGRDFYEEVLFPKIEDLGLTENFEFCGESENVDAYYENSSIHIVTSACESFSMTIAEGKAHARPLVCYAMPYLELLRNRKGHVSVRQGDARGMALEVVKLLSDNKYRDQLGKEAKDSLEEFTNDELAKKWSELFSDLELGSVRANEEEIEAIYSPLQQAKYAKEIIDSTMRIYALGVTQKNAKLKEKYGISN